MKLYRWLLKLYPARFREEYATPLERQFQDDYRDARGPAERTAFFVRTFWDLAVSIPIEVLRELRQDLRYAVRIYRRRALVTALAITALALGIGATTGIFSVLNAVLLRSLPFRDPERLVELSNSSFASITQTAGSFHDRRRHSVYLKDVSTFATNEVSLSRSGESVRVRLTESSANFFETLGTETIFGRAFAEGEDVPGRDNVAVIGYGLWQEAFGGDPRVLGSSIRLNGSRVTLIGVAQAGFDYPDKTQVWTPSVFDLQRVPKGTYMTRVVGRLKSGLNLPQARSMFDAEERRVNAARFNFDEVNRPHLTSLRDQLAGPVRQASLVLFGMVAFVLLIACANVAQLLLARTTERRQELTMRAALGASRARLVQQLVTEGILLTLVAAAAGLAVAEWASRLAASVQPAPLAAQAYAILDGHVLAFAVGIAILTGMFFGLGPALVLGHAQPGVQRPGLRRMRASLIAMQYAFTIVLLAGAITAGRSFLKLLRTDLGFQASQVVTLNVSLSGSAYERDHSARDYYDTALDRLHSVPGVVAAGAVGYLPLEAYGMYSGAAGLRVDGGPKVGVAIGNVASPGYFRAMGEDVVSGREFDSADDPNDHVVIVNEQFAREAGLGSAIVGRTVNLKPPAKIIGVVRTARTGGPAQQGGPEFYFPIDQHWSPYLSFVARVKGDVTPYLAICRDVVQRMDPEIPVYDVKTLEQRLTETLVRPRFYATAIVFLSGFALLLAVLGVYGVVTHSIAQRTHEMGVRLAVGASSAILRATVLRESLIPIVLGMAVGVGVADGLGRLLTYLVPSTAPLSVSTSAAAAAILMIAASISIWTASARLVRIDPNTALRAQ